MQITEKDMDIYDFENLIDKCTIRIGENNTVLFEPLHYNYRSHVNEIVKKYHMENMSVADFTKMAAEHHPLYTARKKLKQKKREEFSTLTPKQVAELPIEEKIAYMEALFLPNQKLEEFLDVCKKNEKNIKVCLYNMDFPKSFWKEERQQAERYASLIARNKKIVDNIRNWPDTTLEEKKETIMEAREVYKYVYKIAPEIRFFKEDEEQARNVALGFNENTMIDAAYVKENVIYFNEDQLQGSDNFYAVSVLFHEGTHCRQDSANFNDDVVNRIFNSDISNLIVYDSMVKERNKADFRDLYTMLPSETHAHGVQQYMEGILTEKTGISKVCYEPETKEVEMVLNKAFAMAAITQARSSKL